jgi:hypothetical protein
MAALALSSPLAHAQKEQPKLATVTLVIDGMT